MGTYSTSMTISEEGTYNINLHLWMVTINFTTNNFSSDEDITFKSRRIRIYHKVDGSYSYIGDTYFSRDFIPRASYIIYEPGEYKASLTYETSTNVSVEFTIDSSDDGSTKTITIDPYYYTISIKTHVSAFQNLDVTVTTPNNTTMTIKVGHTVSSLYSGRYTASLVYDGVTYTQSIYVDPGSTGTKWLYIDPTKIVSWSDGSISDIINMLNAVDDGLITVAETGWEVGDIRTETTTAITGGTDFHSHAQQQIELVIMEKIGYYSEAAGGDVGHFIIGMKDCLAEGEWINKTASNQSLDFLYNLLSGLHTSFFSGNAILNLFKSFDLHTYDISQGKIRVLTGTKVGLLSEKEVLGSRSYGYSQEISDEHIPGQLTWFKTAANKKKMINGSYKYWWLRSPRNSGSTQFCAVNTSGGGSVSQADQLIGWSMFFVI